MNQMGLLIDVFKKIEFVQGQIYTYNGNTVISSIDPNYLSFVPDVQRPKSGGCSVKFITNTPEIKINYSITDQVTGNFPHVGISAQRGLSASYRVLGKDWRNIDCFNSRGDVGEVIINSSDWISNEQDYEVAIYLPINCYITQLTIEICSNCNIVPALRCEGFGMHTVLILGGKVGYGLGVTGTQFMFGHILERHIEKVNVINISFNSDNLLEIYRRSIGFIPELLKCDAICLEIPYDENLTDKKDIMYKFLTELSNVFSGKIILWYKPCFENEYLKWAGLLERYSNENSNIMFDRTFVIKSNYEYEMLMHSKHFVNDNGNVFIMKQIKEMIEKIWNI